MINRADTNEKICFVIAPIGEPGSDIRKRSDQILEHIIRPVVESCGYKAVRADEIPKPGLITNQIIRHIVEAPLVIADLTGQNPNVFYELAIRHAVRKPLIQIINKVEDIPFDVGSMRTIVVNHQDLDSVKEAKAEIKRQIQSLEKSSSSLENPISVALDGGSIDKIKKRDEDYLEEIKKIQDQNDEILRRINAETVADDPEEAKQAVVNIRVNPTASLIDKAIAQAVFSQQQGKRDEAIEKWRAIAQIAKGIDNNLAARAWFSVGYLLGDSEESISAYDRAISLKPDYVEAYNSRGATKGELGRPEDAITDFDEAIRLKSDHVEAYYNRGIAKGALGQHNEAIADYDETIRLKPDYVEAYNNRGNAKDELGQPEDAITDFDEAIRLKSDHVEAYYNRGIAKGTLDLIDEARQDFEKARDLARDAGNDRVANLAEQRLRDLDD